MYVKNNFVNFRITRVFELNQINIQYLISFELYYNIFVGAHTIGVAHCGAFSRRLYNFTGNGDTDPSLDPTYAASLKSQCPNPASASITVEMDPQSSESFDTQYFTILKQNKGLFQSDAALITNRASAKIVDSLLNPASFFSEFGKSMKNMGEIEVLTGNAGEIRTNCRIVNA